MMMNQVATSRLALLLICLIASAAAALEYSPIWTSSNSSFNNTNNSTRAIRNSTVLAGFRVINTNRPVIVGEDEDEGEREENSNNVEESNNNNNNNNNMMLEEDDSQSPPTLQRRVCYFANWAPYRDLSPPLYPDDIDPALCTHIHYAFAKIDLQTLALLPTEEHDMNWTERTNMPLYIRLYGLKRRNMALKILLAVGGWSAKSDGFNLATRSHQNRSRFINQTIKLLREWNFDGVDLDWEFPGDRERGADVASRENFNALVNEFRLAVNAESEATGKRRLLITSAVAADPKKIDNGYVVKNLCAQLDYISVMTYDYHGTWDEVTGLNSPLYARDSEPFNETKSSDWKNANFSINYWIQNGCPAEKINFGLAAYGRSFTLKNTTLNRVGAPALKGGQAGAYTKEEGIFSYYEICEKLNVDGWRKHWDDNQQSFYATRDDQWVGFDNQRSISLKVKWASSMSLGGTMLWTLDFDDYTGQFCNEGTFPIANAIKSVFDEFSVTTATTTSAAVTAETAEDDGSMTVTTTTTSTTTGNASTTTSSKLGFFIGSGDVVFSGSINGISIGGYDSSLGAALPPSLVAASNNNNSNLTAAGMQPPSTQVLVDAGLQNSAITSRRVVFLFRLVVSSIMVAIIIPYRDREDHLITLLSYLHPILQRQQLEYRIYVTEQWGNGTFNKAIIMNAAFIYAFDQDNYHCYCFHDVDLVPEDDRNMYSCSPNPKHMSIGVDEMNYKLQYEELIGGVLILKTEHVIAANGYSNLYWGWGAEDDDLYYRLKGLGYKVERPPPKIGRYKMMKHEKRKPQLWSKRAKLLYSSVNRMTWDGISSAKYKLISVRQQKLFTHLLIDVGEPPPGFS